MVCGPAWRASSRHQQARAFFSLTGHVAEANAGAPVKQSIADVVTQVGVALAHPFAIVGALLFGLAWLVFQPATFGWQAAAAIATLIVALFVLRLIHDIGQKVQAKIDQRLIAVAARPAPPDAVEMGRDRER